MSPPWKVELFDRTRAPIVRITANGGQVGFFFVGYGCMDIYIRLRTHVHMNVYDYLHIYK